MRDEAQHVYGGKLIMKDFVMTLTCILCDLGKVISVFKEE